MNKENSVSIERAIEEMDQNVLRAVYALNMCSVSVSQIIDYNDVYILEQEYEAILNNLNLEKMPKAKALKKILVELLNTITFFRIHEIRKAEIDKKYQKRMKNAIWSAVPNLSVIVSGKPITTVLSIATLVGTGYMNYRKEKNNAFTEKEKEELELRITAIEQFHALRRELFTTAWELAEEYGFPDIFRLTEKQIKQYNQILMDRSELRKYVRLEAIKDKFYAFPPFWYHFGHTASFIANDQTLPLEEWEREYYRNRAKEHFCQYEKLNKFNILREDLMTSACALEYADLLLLEENPDKNKITELIYEANEKCGMALDVKQLCSIAYLKIGNTTKAAELLRELVNEEYNTITNAKLLSRIYVSQFLHNSSNSARVDYRTLLLRIGQENESYLFPMPEGIKDDRYLQTEYLVEMKNILTTDYIDVLNQFLRDYTIQFNAIIPAPFRDSNFNFNSYYGYNQDEIQRRLDDMEKILKSEDSVSYKKQLEQISFRFKILDLLNEAMRALDELELWKNSVEHDQKTRIVKNNIMQNKGKMKEIQERMDKGTFSLEDYKTLQRDLSFRALVGEMWNDMREVIMASIMSMKSMEDIEKAEYNLAEFCERNEINMVVKYENSSEAAEKVQDYFDYSLFGNDGINEQKNKENTNRKRNLVKSAAENFVIGAPKDVAVLLPEEKEFELYFKNKKFTGGYLQSETLFIIDDRTFANHDLIFTPQNIVSVKRNQIVNRHSYNAIEYSNSSIRGESLTMGTCEEYYNKNVNIGKLICLIEDFRKIDQWANR